MKKITLLILLISCQPVIEWYEYAEPWRLFLGRYTVENIQVNLSPSDQLSGTGKIETWPEQETLGNWRLEGKIFQVENWDEDHNGFYEVVDRDKYSFTIENDDRKIVFDKYR